MHSETNRVDTERNFSLDNWNQQLRKKEEEMEYFRESLERKLAEEMEKVSKQQKELLEREMILQDSFRQLDQEKSNKE